MPSGKSEIKVTASDALEFERVETKIGKPKRRVRALLVGIALVGAGAGAWAAYGSRLVEFVGGSGVEVETPLVRAEITPVKIRPDNPGGLQVPNRDKLVYGRMQGAATSEEQTVERLLAEPEKPLSAPTETAIPTIAKVPKLADVRQAQPPPPPKAPTAASGAKAPLKLSKSSAPIRLDKNIGSKPNKSSDSKPAAIVSKPKTAVAKPALPSKTVAKQVAPNPQPIASKISPPAKMKTASRGVYRVQLAAARTEELAQTEWNRVRRRNLDLLGDLGLAITRADLGTKGVFYRVRVGPLADDARARALCGALSKRKIGCLVIKPDRL
mgnify:CR=1 FL=1